MRFCLITTFFPPQGFGGDAIYVQRLARALVRMGHHVEVIHCQDSYEALAPAGSRAKPVKGHRGTLQGVDGVIVHRLHSRLGPLSPLATYLTGRPLFKRRRIGRILEAGKFDVIHYHNISLVGGPALLALGNAVKLYTMHEHWLLCPTHVLFRFNRALCTRRTCILCQLAHRRPIQLWRHSDLLKRSLQHVDAFLALTRFTRDLHQARYPELPWRHLPPFAVPSLANPSGSAVQLLPEKPFFLYVGRLERLKGVQTLIPLFQQQEANAAPADLVIVGQGSLAEDLKRQVQRMGSRIHLIGYLAAEELPAIYARAIAVLVPTLTYEVFNQVIVEAFAQATPVIVRDLGPLPEIVREAGGGLTYRDDTELLTHLRHLAKDQSERERLGRSGQEAIATLWSERSVLARYLAIIEELRSQRSLPAPLP